MTLRLALAGAAALVLALPAAPVLAQTDPAALDLIQRLRPQSGSTRGIRVPGAADTAPPAPSVQPAPIYSTPRAPQPNATVAGPGAPIARPAPAARETTATDGVAAANITVTFPSGSATLTPEAERQLAPLGRALASADLAAFRFRIEGHTDTVGDAASNQALSERRAAAVRNFLMQRYNVDAGRLTAVGMGETQPLVATGDEVAQPRNRRVQIVNVGG
ncbi:MAG: OmpA family protein [Pseudomonadota bacterium]